MSTKLEKQVNDDDVRKDLPQRPTFAQDDWYFPKDQIDLVKKMHFATDPTDRRLDNLRAFCVWMMKQCDDKFMTYKLFGNYFDSELNYQILKLTWIENFRYVLDELIQMEVSPSS